MPRRTTARYSAPALEKGLDVLELLATEPHGLGLQEIAQRLARSPAELYRMLDVLVQRGFLTRLPDTTYALTLRLFELAHRHPPVDRLLDVAVPHMQALARRTGQSNHLSVHHDARLVVLARAEPPEPMSCLVRQGAHFAFHDDRVSARVITAFQTGRAAHPLPGRAAGRAPIGRPAPHASSSGSSRSARAATTRGPATPSAAWWTCASRCSISSA